MKRLDDSIQNLYNQWILDAPAGYFDDDFFTSRVPVAITSRFGQNQQLARNREEELQERTNWRQERDYSRIRYITLAVASHVGYMHFLLTIFSGLTISQGKRGPTVENIGSRRDNGTNARGL
jgi:hypothetical protein